jgi:hypothetical protein
MLLVSTLTRRDMRERLHSDKLVEHRSNTSTEQLTYYSWYTDREAYVRHDALASRVFDFGGSIYEHVAQSALDFENTKCEQKRSVGFTAQHSRVSGLQTPVSTTHDDWCGNHDYFAPT